MENDNWKCEKDGENIVCREQGEYASSTVKMEGGRGSYATIKNKTDRGDEILATTNMGSLNFKSNTLKGVRSIDNGQIRGRLE